MQGQLGPMLTLLQSEGPGDTTVHFCMASALATLVLDEEVMQLMKDRGEAPMLFVHSIEILKTALARLAPDAPEPPANASVTVKMAEAMSQAMWGAAYYCTLPGGGGVEDRHVMSLGSMGAAAWSNGRHATAPQLQHSTRACMHACCACVSATTACAGTGWGAWRTASQRRWRLSRAMSAARPC
jgi:hypothetical protein